ncbi:MAG: dihydrolipoyl dehydrogenase [Deltaproteobacteria bacterium]|nr:dihydrolipoyl dehydrogenase [Deltaproteobacteria bacterium]
MAAHLVVIGAGPGGYQAAIRAAQLGARVTVVEKDRLGGTCLNWGCIPTKALKAVADCFTTCRTAGELGVELAAPPRLNWPVALARKDQVVETQVGGIARLFQAHGVELVTGEASLAGPHEIRVRQETGEVTLTADQIILATGSRPAELAALPRDGRNILNSDDILSLPELPASLAVVGGGVVGAEFAAILAALGCRVTVIEALDRVLPLPSLDPEISRLLTREMKKQGITLKTSRLVTACEPHPEGLELVLEPTPQEGKPATGRPESLVVAKVLVAVGRALNSQGLNLERAGLTAGPGGAVTVDRTLRTAQPHILAVGDLLGPSRPLLAHVAGLEGRAAAANALGAHQEPSYDLVPATVFTHPEVAWVGLSPAQAQAQGLAASRHTVQLRILGAAQARGELAGQITLISETNTGRLLGAHLAGLHATEMVHTAALALAQNATVADLAHLILAHPTFSEALGEAAETALGLALHAPPVR